MVMRHIYFNGQIIPECEATISIHDGGWLHGAGLFETMRAQNGRMFRVEKHIERLRRSAATILRPIERGMLPSRVDFLELLERNRLRSARVRLTVSAGSMLAETDPPNPPCQEGQGGSAQLTVCATAAPLSLPPSAVYEHGAAVVICSFRQSPEDAIAGHKTTAYLPRLLGLREAQRAKCLEAIWFTTQHLLAEGCLSNVFVVSDGVLKTPPLDTPVLPGIARGAVLELARSLEIDAQECPLTINELLDADEVFLTNAIMRVMPVIKVEKKGVGTGKPGPITNRMRKALEDLAEKECGGP